MKTQFRYILEPGSRKYHCPGCRKKRFVRYVDTATGEYLPPEYGRCDRLIDCGYFLNPYKDGFAKGNPTPTDYTPPPPEPPKPPTFFDFVLFNQSLAGYDNNNFVQYLYSKFDSDTIKTLCSQYQIGTSKHWPGATIFWQTDVNGNIRGGKVMGYDSATGKRIKEPFPQITWIHKILKLEGFNLRQCLYGEHLLTLYPEKTVCIVESEKTAIIAAGYVPQYLWLATGSVNAINPERFAPLQNRKILMFPDLNGFDLWQKKAAKLTGFDISISDLLERKAPAWAKAKGLDIADFLKPEAKPPKPPLPPTPMEAPPAPRKPEPTTHEFISLCQRVKAGEASTADICNDWDIADGREYQLQFLEVVGKYRFFENNKYLHK